MIPGLTVVNPKSRFRGFQLFRFRCFHFFLFFFFVFFFSEMFLESDISSLFRKALQTFMKFSNLIGIKNVINICMMKNRFLAILRVTSILKLIVP